MSNQLVNKCVRCEVAFEDWKSYHMHQSTQTCFKKIVPLNTSGRTKTQIVNDWEYLNHKHLIY